MTYIVDIWDALSVKYLNINEISSFRRIKIEKKYNYVALIKKRIFSDLWQRMKNFGEMKCPFIDLIDGPFIRIDRKCAIKPSKAIKTARLIARNSGFDILINNDIFFNENQNKLKRYLIAHELGHTFLFNTEIYPIKPLFSNNDNFHVESEIRNSIWKEEEDFSFEIGRYILAPTEYLPQVIPKEPSIQAFIDGLENFQIADEILGKRLFQDTYNWKNGESYWNDASLIIFKNHHSGQLSDECQYFHGTNYLEKIRDNYQLQSEIQSILCEIYPCDPNKKFQKNIDMNGLNWHIEILFPFTDSDGYILITPRLTEKNYTQTTLF